MAVVGLRMLSGWRGEDAALLSGKIFDPKPKQDSTRDLPETSATKLNITEREACENEIKRPLAAHVRPEDCSRENMQRKVRSSSVRPIGYDP